MPEETPPAETAPTPPDATETDAPGPEEQLAAALKEAEKWKGLARKNEDRAKANATAAKEIEELRKSAMSDQERAVAEAVEKAINEERGRNASTLVAAELRAAAAGRLDDNALAAILEGVNTTAFITETGDPDTDAIRGWLDRIVPAPTEQKPETGVLTLDLGQGARGGNPQNMALDSDPLMKDLRNKLGI